MAEALARAYGSDVMEAQSAGVSPATTIAPLTQQSAERKKCEHRRQFPKGLDLFTREQFDVIVNMSGTPLAHQSAAVIDWPVPDPIGQSRKKSTAPWKSRSRAW